MQLLEPMRRDVQGPGLPAHPLPKIDFLAAEGGRFASHLSSVQCRGRHVSCAAMTRHWANVIAALLLGLCLIGSATKLRAVAPAAASPTEIVWKLDNTDMIGGHKPQLLGAPTIVNAPSGGPALQFNGRSDGLIVPVNPIAGWRAFAIQALLRPAANGPRAQRFLHIADQLGRRVLMETRSSGNSWVLDTYLARTRKGRTLRNRAKHHPAGQWAWVALVYDGKKMSHYVNGMQELQGRTVFPPMTNGVTSLGMRLNQVFWFKGCLKEVRFTPVALPAEALQRNP